MNKNKKPLCEDPICTKSKISAKLIGFTLAEIIVAMTIIGVIAAITIPALLVSTNEKTLEAQKKALYARISQSMSQIEDIRLYEKSGSDASGNTIDKSSAVNFISKALSKVYRITKVCDINNIETSCDFPNEITTPSGRTFNISTNSHLTDFIDNSSITASTFGGLNTEVAGFKTANGESIALFYNPKCRGAKTNGYFSGNAAVAMCINMIYDLNGAKEAPNEVGKDVGFLTVFFPKDSDVTLPMAYGKDVDSTFTDYVTAINACKTQNKSLVIPNWEEGMSIALNKKLSEVEDSSYVVSGTGSVGVYKVDVATLISSTAAGFADMKLRCVYNK